jgi:hypothetical protein
MEKSIRKVRGRSPSHIPFLQRFLTIGDDYVCILEADRETRCVVFIMGISGVAD